MEDFSPIDLNNWNRKDQFHFFRNHDIPFFNITANLDVTDLYRYSKTNNYSFFLSTLFYSINAANEIKEFKYRIKNDSVICCDSVEAGSTILLDDNTFSFCYFNNYKDLSEFNTHGKLKIAEEKDSPRLNPNYNRLDLIYYSVIPWISFTSFQHARKFIKDDTIPRIVFGKIFDEGKKKLMPVSVEVHHSMMDGYHVGLFFEKFQNLIHKL